MRSPRTFVALAIFLAVAIVVALWFGGGAPRSSLESPMQPPAPVTVERERAIGDAPRIDDDAATKPRVRVGDAQANREAREALRRDIVHALERRGIDANEPSAGAPGDDPADGAPRGGMVDRIGGRPALLERFNDDFMPLADECMEQARERVPDLRGIVAIDVKLLAERDVGAIVEDAQPAAVNEIADPELLECLQQTLYSMTLPGEAVDGLEGVMISLRADET